MGLRSSYLHVAMIEVTEAFLSARLVVAGSMKMLQSITSIIATWRVDDLRPTLKPLSGLLTAHSVLRFFPYNYQKMISNHSFN